MKGFGQITRKYLGQTFDECTCLQLIYNIYKDMGFILTTFEAEYNGHNMNNYMPYWEIDPDQAIKDMIEVLKITGRGVNPKFLKPGDITVIEHKDSKFPSIYVGNNNIMVSTREQGVIVMPLGNKFQPVMARRLI